MTYRQTIIVFLDRLAARYWEWRHPLVTIALKRRQKELAALFTANNEKLKQLNQRHPSHPIRGA